ncbi:putative triacylglycerol lipase [Helianthus annuus]|nr:putative triacylglycerol lipase [Helianthus annuus]
MKITRTTLTNKIFLKLLYYFPSNSKNIPNNFCTMFSIIGSLRLRLLSLYSAIKALPVNTAEALLSLYFCYYCNLSPCTVDLDDCQTSMHIWAPHHRSCKKPNMVLVHGYGGNSKWQFVFQVAQLTREFNIYIPDLVFFGKSYSTRSERTDVFQAKCVCDGMKKLGVERFSAYGLSYGGYVVYRMAALEEKMVEKVVIVSSGIVYMESQKAELLKKIGRNVVDVLVPETPEEIRTLCRMSMHKFDVGRLFPDFFLRAFIAVIFFNSFFKDKYITAYVLQDFIDVLLGTLSRQMVTRRKSKNWWSIYFWENLILIFLFLLRLH